MLYCKEGGVLSCFFNIALLSTHAKTIYVSILTVFKNIQILSYIYSCYQVQWVYKISNENVKNMINKIICTCCPKTQREWMYISVFAEDTVLNFTGYWNPRSSTIQRIPNLFLLRENTICFNAFVCLIWVGNYFVFLV